MTGAQGSDGSSSASARPGSRARARGALAEALFDVGDHRCEPLLGERPFAFDPHRLEPFLELLGAEHRPRGQRRATRRLVDERGDDLAGIAGLEERDAGLVARARRRGIEHRRTADGRLGPQDDVVAAGRDHRDREAELRVAVAATHHAGGGATRAVVDGQTGTVGDGLQLLEHDVEPVRHGKRRRRDEDVAPPDGVAVEPRQRERDPRACRRPLDRLVVHLHASHPHLDVPRLEPEHVALADRARPQRSGHDRPDPTEAEHPVDVKTRGEADRALARPCRPQPRGRRGAPRAPRRSARSRGRSPPPAAARAPPRRRAARSPRRPRRSSSPPRRPRRRRAAGGSRDARGSAAARPRRRRARAGRGRSRSPPPPSCARTARAPARRPARASSRPGGRAAHTRGRSRCRGDAPPAGGRCPCR